MKINLNVDTENINIYVVTDSESGLKFAQDLDANTVFTKERENGLNTTFCGEDGFLSDETLTGTDLLVLAAGDLSLNAGFLALAQGEVPMIATAPNIRIAETNTTLGGEERSQFPQKVEKENLIIAILRPEDRSYAELLRKELKEVLGKDTEVKDYTTPLPTRDLLLNNRYLRIYGETLLLNGDCDILISGSSNPERLSQNLSGLQLFLRDQPEQNPNHYLLTGLKTSPENLGSMDTIAVIDDLVASQLKRFYPNLDHFSYYGRDIKEGIQSLENGESQALLISEADLNLYYGDTEYFEELPYSFEPVDIIPETGHGKYSVTVCEAQSEICGYFRQTTDPGGYHHAEVFGEMLIVRLYELDLNKDSLNFQIINNGDKDYFRYFLKERAKEPVITESEEYDSKDYKALYRELLEVIGAYENES